MQQISKSWQALLDQVPLSSVCLIDKAECGKPSVWIHYSNYRRLHLQTSAGTQVTFIL